jgi:hypothetical protein
MISFVTYVLSFKDSDCALGDVARDMMLDTAISKRWGFPRLIKHLVTMNADGRVYGVLEEANFVYNHSRL